MDFDTEGISSSDLHYSAAHAPPEITSSFLANEGFVDNNSGIWASVAKSLREIETGMRKNSREQSRAVTRFYNEAHRAYDCVEAELKHQPSQIISDTVKTLVSLPLEGMQELIFSTNKSQGEVMDGFRNIVQEIKQEYNGKLKAQNDEQGDKFGYLRDLAARNMEALTWSENPCDTATTNSRRPSVEDCGSVPASVNRGVTAPRKSWNVVLGLQQTDGDVEEDPATPQALPEKGTEKDPEKGTEETKSSVSEVSPEHWGMSRGIKTQAPSTTSRRSSAWSPAKGPDADENAEDPGPGIEGILQREDEILDHLIENGAQPGQGELPEGVADTLRILGWRVKQLETENERLRFKVQTPVDTARRLKTPAAQGFLSKVTRWADALVTTHSVVDSIPSSAKTPSPKKRPEGLTDTPQVSGPRNILSLVEELVALDFGSGLTTPVTAKSALTPPIQRVNTPVVTAAARSVLKHTSTLAPVLEAIRNGIEVPRPVVNGVEVPRPDIETTVNGVEGPGLAVVAQAPSNVTAPVRSPYSFPRLPVLAVPEDGALTSSILWIYIYNLIFAALEPPMHAIFWVLVLFRELGQVWRITGFYLSVPDANTPRPRLPIFPIMPARSLAGLVLYSAIYVTANMYIATSRERAIWLQANRMTRVYMLETARRPQSWMGIPGVDGNLTVGFKDVVEKIGQAYALLGYCVRFVWEGVWGCVEAWVAALLQVLKDCRSYVGRLINGLISSATAILIKSANATDSG